MSSALRHCALRRHRPSHHRAATDSRNVVPCKDVRCDAAKRRFEPSMPGGKQMLDEKDLMLALKRHWDYSGMDEDVSHEIYHDDAVLEFPQSGERFEGVENFREWRRQYPARIAFHTRRITHRDDLVVVENLISYDGAPWMYSVNLLEFQGDKVAHERRTRQAGDGDKFRNFTASNPFAPDAQTAAGQAPAAQTAAGQAHCPIPNQGAPWSMNRPRFHAA